MTISNPASLVYSRGYNNRNYDYIYLEDHKLIDSLGEVIFDARSDNITDFRVVHSYTNFWGLESFGQPTEFRTVNQTDLPPKPQFTVKDNPNSEGDNNLIFWDKPTVNLMDTSFLNRERTRLLINYEYQTNDDYKIDNIFFDVYDDEGNHITHINEFYQNLFFRVTLPEKYNINSPEYDENRFIKFHITFSVSGDELPEDYIFEQQLAFDENYMSYRPQTLYLRGDPIENFSYSVYKKPYAGETFSLSSRVSGIIRETEDTINYINDIFRPIQRVIPEQQLYLIDTSIDAFYDKENRRPVTTHIFYSLVERKMSYYQQEVENLKMELDKVDSEEEKAHLQNQIDQYQLQLAMNEYEFMQEANQQPSDRARMRMIVRRRERELRTFQYKMVNSNGRGLFVETDVYEDNLGNKYFFPVPNWFDTERTTTLIATLIFGFLVYIMVKRAKQGKDMYIRPIAGIEEIDNAIGRATEMGRPILFNPGLDGISVVSTLAGLAILGRVAKKAAEYDTKLIVPCRDFIVTPIAQEIVKEAHYEAGRPDTFDKNSVFFLASQQFAFVAGVSGIMIREKCATNFYMGAYYAEALIMTEVGNTVGAIQIAGTDAITQVPFFITTCDYTLIGEELYGAAAYLGREPMMMATLKATDAMKILILTSIIIGSILSTAQLTFFIDLFPGE